MRELALFSALQQKLKSIDSDFTINNGFLDFDVDYSVGIYITDAQPAYKLLNGQKHLGHTARVQFLWQGAQTSESVFKLRNHAQRLEDSVLKTNNEELETDKHFYIDSEGFIAYDPEQEHTGIKLFISLTDTYSGIINAGKTADGHPTLSLNAVITYYI